MMCKNYRKALFITICFARIYGKQKGAFKPLFILVRSCPTGVGLPIRLRKSLTPQG
jgi:hypothetical protein